jgi:heparinase II/III-like protein
MVDLNTIEQVCAKYPKRIKRFFKTLDYTRKELAHIEKEILTKDYITASKYLLQYYKENYSSDWIDFDDFAYKPKFLDQLDDIEKDIVTFQSVSAKIPRLSTGYWDWSFQGPDNDREFGYFLNRMHYLKVLYEGYKQSSNEKYIVLFDKILQDWLISNPRPRFYKSTVQWRTLEAALRFLWVFPFCFFGFQSFEKFSDATKLLFLMSVPEHAEYLRKYVVPRGNIRVMILTALGTIGAIWPEFKKSKKWIQISIQHLTPELLNLQVYPDGAQKELTHHYHYVAAINFEHLRLMVIKSGQKVSDEYFKRLQAMWNYYFQVIRPDGYGLLNNDSDRDFVKPRAKKLSKVYNRADWEYIGSNGDTGDQPKDVSNVFPWAGQLIMRSNWTSDAHWAFFDFGPFGIGHQHKDKLHLSISAYGRDLLVDGGRYRYINDIWRKKYFRASSSHNTIMIDGKGQKAYQKSVKQPIDSQFFEITPEFDYAKGIYSAGYEGIKDKIVHQRVVKYYRNKFWIVIDTVQCEKPHKVNILWHFHPNCVVENENNCVKTQNSEKGNLRITPINETNWDLQLIKGQKKPVIQGWWSREYNHKEPNVCAQYSAKVENKQCFIWLIDVAENPLLPISDISTMINSNQIELGFLRNKVQEKLVVKL